MKSVYKIIEVCHRASGLNWFEKLYYNEDVFDCDWFDKVYSTSGFKYQSLTYPHLTFGLLKTPFTNESLWNTVNRCYHAQILLLAYNPERLP